MIGPKPGSRKKSRRVPKAVIAVVIIAMALVAAFFLYPRPVTGSTYLQCELTRYGIFTAVSVVGTSSSTVNATETSVTSFTSTTGGRGSVGSVVVAVSTYSNISAIAPGMSAAGNITRCTYEPAPTSTP